MIPAGHRCALRGAGRGGLRQQPEAGADEGTAEVQGQEVLNSVQCLRDLGHLLDLQERNRRCFSPSFSATCFTYCTYRSNKRIYL